ncbi:binding partner of ACD11 1-like isoform X2 [Nymphaea colorata]|uniref:binding partner of ACD11 1-like isoform X2 n=1 Tax=Nymphaea colorata TaxID=210225 RepID=UPI00214E6BCE|nr:binding partner of ACD11 1-like isoform X2 [Nymphaea colorata]
MSVRTVKVSNISLQASEQEVKEFFSFSGDIEYVEMRRETDHSQLAYVTFKESQGADTAMLLTGATIVDLSVNITPAEDYKLPPEIIAKLAKESEVPSAAGSAVQKAEEVVSSMLAKGFVLGKDALNKAKEFDEKLQLTSNATATVASLDQKIGLSDKMREMNERFQFSEKTKSVLDTAGTAIMSNRYVFTSAAWVSSALNMVAKAAEDVSLKTKEKIEKAEEEKRESIYRERTDMISNFAQIHLDESSADEPATLPLDHSGDMGKLGII